MGTILWGIITPKAPLYHSKRLTISSMLVGTTCHIFHTSSLESALKDEVLILLACFLDVKAWLHSAILQNYPAKNNCIWPIKIFIVPNPFKATQKSVKFGNLVLFNCWLSVVLLFVPSYKPKRSLKYAPYILYIHMYIYVTAYLRNRSTIFSESI